jgi:hypothetical protein
MCILRDGKKDSDMIEFMNKVMIILNRLKK